MDLDAKLGNTGFSYFEFVKACSQKLQQAKRKADSQAYEAEQAARKTARAANPDQGKA